MQFYTEKTPEEFMQHVEELMAASPYYRVKLKGSRIRIKRFGSGFPTLSGRSTGLEPLTVKLYNTSVIWMFIIAVILFGLMLWAGTMAWPWVITAVVIGAASAWLLEYIMRPLIFYTLAKDFGLKYKVKEVECIASYVVDIKGINSKNKGSVYWDEIEAVDIDRQGSKDIISVKGNGVIVELPYNALNIGIILHYYKGEVKNLDIYR